MKLLWLPALLLLAVPANSQTPLPPLDPLSAGKVSYRKDVAPILRRHCLSCHTKNDMQGGLSMDTVKLFTAGGKKGVAILSGKPDDSLSVQMMTGLKKPAMPHKQPALSLAKSHTIRQWILAGAKDDSEPVTSAGRFSIPKSYRIPPAVTGLAFSPDGKLLAAACRSEVVVLSAEGKGTPQRLETESDLITCLAFSPSGQFLASIGGSPGDYGEVRLFQVAEPALKLRSSRKVSKDTLFRGEFSPDGKTLALGGADGAIHLVPVDEKAELRRYDLHSDWISDVAFSPDGRLLFSVSRDKTIKVCLTENGKLLRSLATSADYVNAVAATSTIAISAGRDRIPAIYDLKQALGDVATKGNTTDMVPDRPSAQYTRKLEGQAGEVFDLGVDLKRTKLAVAGAGGEVRLYALPAGNRLANLTPVPSPVYAVALTSDGTRVATGSYNGQVGIYDAANGKLIRQLIPVPVE